MTKLIYDGRPNHILIEDGEQIHPGDEFTVSEERAAQLLADSQINVHEAPTATAEEGVVADGASETPEGSAEDRPDDNGEPAAPAIVEGEQPAESDPAA